MMQVITWLWLLFAAVDTEHLAQRGRAAVPLLDSENARLAQLTHLASLNVEQLPIGFVGDSVRAVIDEVARGPKSEFETAAQYAARAKQLEPGRLLAFVLAPNDESGPFVSYDAGAQQFEIRIWEQYGARKEFQNIFNVRPIIVTKRVLAEDSYRATNAFGATATVLRRRLETFAVAVEQPTPGPGDERLHKMFIPVAQANAPAMKSRLGVLLVCAGYTGQRDQTFDGFESSEATLSGPYERTITRHYLMIGGLYSAWIYDSETGRILKKGNPF